MKVTAHTYGYNLLKFKRGKHTISISNTMIDLDIEMPSVGSIILTYTDKVHIDLAAINFVETYQRNDNA